MSQLSHDSWAGTTYGNGWMHRSLVKMLRALDVRLLYGVASVLAVPPTMAVNHRATGHIYRYLRRMGKRPLRAAWLTYRNHCRFAQVVIDRFAMYAGRRFDITVDGYEHFKHLASLPGGFVQLSSHIGNYEIAGYSLRADDKRFNALVFGGEKAEVMEGRRRLFAANNIGMIPMRDDMSHLFEIDSALSAGEILSMPADRIFGSQKYFELPFLGETARFPQGPFVVAAVKDVPMLFVAVMKTSARAYRVTVRPVATPAALTGRRRAEALAAAYAAMLEETVREYPEQWYNYFDFWAK